MAEGSERIQSQPRRETSVTIDEISHNDNDTMPNLATAGGSSRPESASATDFDTEPAVGG